jgi:hypothetical protein
MGIVRRRRHVQSQRCSVGIVYGFASCSCGDGCRYSKHPVATLCAPDDISAGCRVLGAQCGSESFACETGARTSSREARSFLHVASALQRRDSDDVPAVSLASALGTRRIGLRGVSRRESATALCATQSRQLPRNDALPRQQPRARKRNFALDLPLVAYATQAEYEQMKMKCCSGARR